jgi:hypothetical protein
MQMTAQPAVQLRPPAQRFYNPSAARVSFNGRTLASQANNVGSIPITRSKLRKLYLSLVFFCTHSRYIFHSYLRPSDRDYGHKLLEISSKLCFLEIKIFLDLY